MQKYSSPVEISAVLRFPNEFPKATTGIFFPTQRVLFTGHENGLVVRWRLDKKDPEILHDCSSRVESMASFSDERIVVGCNSGLVIVFTTSDPTKKEVIQQPGHTVYSRVWRVAFPAKDTVVTTSTYGVMRVHRRGESDWDSKNIPGHGDSVFGLASFDGTLLASGDFAGRIFVWKPNPSTYEKSSHLKGANFSAIEGIAWRKDSALAAIDHNGHIYFFEPDKEEAWRSVFEADTARSRGTCIHITDDGKTVFAGSNTEIIQFDLESQQIQLIQQPWVKSIFSSSNMVYALTDDGLIAFERREIGVPANLVKYRYAKVSLIGHTGSGKSTLCSFIVYGTTEGIKSTYGRRIWDWTIQDGAPQKKVIFSDVGGQESVLGTFLPFLADSDIVLIFFKQTDKTTYDRALRLLDELPSIIPRSTKVFLVQTWIDDDMNDVELEEDNIKKFILSGRIVDRLEICPPSGAGVENFKERLEGEIAWSNARTMIQSEYVDGLTRTISELQAKDIKLLAVEDLKKAIETVTHVRISTSHLKFLLSNLSTQGLIEYYPDVLDSVILNDEKFNRLRTEIPRLVDHNKGIISVLEIERKLGQGARDRDYIRILDRVYVRYGVCIENGNARIFPDYLKKDPTVLEEPYKTLLASPIHHDEQEFAYGKRDIGRLIRALSELTLRCIDASTSEGVFAWDTNAAIHYKIQEMGDALSVLRIKIGYTVGAEKEPTGKRLVCEFSSVIERLYGSPLPPTSNPSALKKNDLKSKEFDGALSFAGEQRGYVRRVYEALAGRGAKIFYDEIFQSQMWGKDLAVYLQEVYYSKAKYCLMFVSKEYVAKMWPSHELGSALARQIKDPGYILPIVFDEVDVPGLNFTLGRQDARKKTPEEIADLFLKKLLDAN